MVTSRAVVLRRFEEPLEIDEFEVPDPEPGAVIAEVSLGGVCGTDVHLQQGRLPIPTPIVMGHEAVGRVSKLGPGVQADTWGAPLRQGDWIAWASNIPCGRCYYCLIKNERTLCVSRRVYGINQRSDEWPHLSGGWAEYIYLQPGSTIIRIPDAVSPEEVIALGCAGPTVVHGLLHRSPVAFGDSVAIQGSGPVGIAAAIYARLAGASRITMVGGPTNRLETARALGVADSFVDITDITDPAERVRIAVSETSGERGADLVVECTGVPAAVAEGMAIARPGGRYLVLGQYTDHGPTPLNPHLITRKQLDIRGSWAFSERDYSEYVVSLSTITTKYDLRSLITPYPLDRAGEALADVREGKVIKAVLSAR
jgi:threonine dehydrogenase-like Zn-dependent dehydrogenase